MKKRIDQLLVERMLAPSRERAQSLILSGNVLVDDAPIAKAGQLVPDDAAIRVRAPDHPFVSRGGVKLAAALEAFAVDPRGKTALDIGASTGGFTEVLLLGGARRVYAIDVGHNQLAWKIRSDSRVVVREKVNARDMPFDTLGERVDLIVIDVSFISLEKILPGAAPFAHAKTDWITLIKPQFEVGREKVGKGGIVRSDSDHQAVIARITEFAKSLGLHRQELIESPITGTDGNKEFLALWKSENPFHGS